MVNCALLSCYYIKTVLLHKGKLRSAELLLHKDGSVTQIRRAETYDDLFGTLDFSNL